MEGQRERETEGLIIQELNCSTSSSIWELKKSIWEEKSVVLLLLVCLLIDLSL